MHASQFRQLRVLDNDPFPWEYPATFTTPEMSAHDPITDAGLAHLRNSTRLEALILVATEVTDDGLRHLARLQRLTRLKISSRKITDRAIPHLLKLRNLKDLGVSGTSISEAGVAELRRGLPDCETVGPKNRKK